MDKVRIVGAGAIGLFLASEMKQSETVLEFLCDAERKEKYQSKVFFVNNEPLQINPVTPETVHEPADLIIIAVKYHNLDEAVELLQGSIGPNTVILSLMNGIDSEAIIGKRWGIDKLVHSFLIEVDTVKEDNIIYYNNKGKIILGDISGQYTSAVQKASTILGRSGLNFEISNNIEKEIWWKFMINVGINQASAVLRAPYGVFQENKYASDIMNDAMSEVVRLSQKLGIDLNDQDIQRWQEVLKILGPDKKTSMLQDVEAGRKTEVEMFAGTVCALGQKHGVATPANIMLYNLIKAWERMQGFDKEQQM